MDTYPRLEKILGGQGEAGLEPREDTRADTGHPSIVAGLSPQDRSAYGDRLALVPRMPQDGGKQRKKDREVQHGSAAGSVPSHAFENTAP